MSWCNFQDLSTYVKKINFKLHESYPNPNRGMFCLDVYLFMFDLNWFYLDLVLWVLSSCMNEIASLKKCVRKCLMDVNIVLYYCLCLCEKGLSTLISYFLFQCLSNLPMKLQRLVGVNLKWSSKYISMIPMKDR